MKCNVCGNSNPEVTVKKFKPKYISDWVAVIFTFGLVRHRLCQTCQSRMFRKLDKNK